MEKKIFVYCEKTSPLMFVEDYSAFELEINNEEELQMAIDGNSLKVVPFRTMVDVEKLISSIRINIPC